MDCVKKFDIDCTLKHTITTKDIDDIMADALEGGITYWCGRAEVIGDYLGEYASDQISRGGSLILYDLEDEDEHWTLDLNAFITGYKSSIEQGFWSGDFDNDYDSTVADAIIQLAVFGEIVFG